MASILASVLFILDCTLSSLLTLELSLEASLEVCATLSATSLASTSSFSMTCGAPAGQPQPSPSSIHSPRLSFLSLETCLGRGPQRAEPLFELASPLEQLFELVVHRSLLGDDFLRSGEVSVRSDPLHLCSMSRSASSSSSILT
eukprot:scaffold2858_cov659-Pavlova_lutheri.AAC.51